MLRPSNVETKNGDSAVVAALLLSPRGGDDDKGTRSSAASLMRRAYANGCGRDYEPDKL